MTLPFIEPIFLTLGFSAILIFVLKKFLHVKNAVMAVFSALVFLLVLCFVLFQKTCFPPIRLSSTMLPALHFRYSSMTLSSPATRARI